jgi:hypothetical protein
MKNCRLQRCGRVRAHVGVHARERVLSTHKPSRIYLKSKLQDSVEDEHFV